MAEPSNTCCAVPRSHIVIVVLLVLLGVTTTGWVMTATRERPAATVPAPTPEQARQPAPLPPAPRAPAEPATVEWVEVVVAAKDLPVGTMITSEELRTAVKLKKVPKDGLPPAYVIDPQDMLDRRLARPVRVEETFNPQDLVKGAGFMLPEGYDMVSIPLDAARAAGGFVGPGSRVNVLATVRLNNKLHVFALLVNVLVVAVDTQVGFDQKGAFPNVSTVSFAVTQKQALLLSLAKSRGCTLELLLRNPNKSNESDRDYNIDAVIKVLEDEKVKPNEGEPVEGAPKPAPEPTEVAPAPRPKGEER